MRISMILFITLITFFSASASEPISKNKVKPIELTKVTFLEKVFN